MKYVFRQNTIWQLAEVCSLRVLSSFTVLYYGPLTTSPASSAFPGYVGTIKLNMWELLEQLMLLGLTGLMPIANTLQEPEPLNPHHNEDKT